MKVEVILKTIMAGPAGNGYPGDSLFVDEEEAKELVDGNYASYVEIPETEVEPADLDEDFPSDISVISRGLYELPNGEQVRGKAKTLAAYKAMVAEE